MESPQIRLVGAAMSLTPGFETLLAEASRFAHRLGAALTIIHTGTSEAESRESLKQAAEQLSITHQPIVWNQTDPAHALLSAAKDNGVELLVLGAFEGPLFKRRRFLGSVARHTIEGAKCSLLLVTHPQIDKNEFKRIVAITDFSECSRTACSHALWLGEKDEAEWVRIISIHSIFMEARAGWSRKGEHPARTRKEEEEMLEEFVASLPATNVRVDEMVIHATTGFAACDFAESVEADLLVVPGHNRPGERLPPLADWALQVVPCSLWIVHCGPVWT